MNTENDTVQAMTVVGKILMQNTVNNRAMRDKSKARRQNMVQYRAMTAVATHKYKVQNTEEYRAMTAVNKT